jgi:predicted P-loop ATPase
MGKMDDFLNHEREGDAWKKRLDNTEQRRPRALLRNAIIALSHAPEWQDVLAYDEFAMATMAMRPPPWRKAEDNDWKSIPWIDTDDIKAAEWLQSQNIDVGTKTASEAVEAVAKQFKFHPVRDYLRSDEVKWDGKPRVDRFAQNYLGAEDTEYHRNVSRSMFVASVARVFQPGCKHDQVVLLEGRQGAFKSTALNELFSPWYTDDLADLGSKDASMQLQSVWCIEIAELSAMRRPDVERIKSFLSRRVDRFRPSYGRRVISAPRQCVLIATTNDDCYLLDVENRRFFPIATGKIDLEMIKRDRDQLWAEAVHMYDQGDRWWIEADNAEAKEQQELRREAHAWQDKISAFLEDKDETTIGAIFDHLDVPMTMRRRGEQMGVAHCLKVAGFKRIQARDVTGERHYCYRRRAF